MSEKRAKQLRRIEGELAKLRGEVATLKSRSILRPAKESFFQKIFGRRA